MSSSDDTFQTPPPPEPPRDNTPSQRSFFSALFDFRFETYVTPKVVPVLYVLGIVAVALAYISWVITAFSVNAGFGLFVLLIGGPIVSILILTFLKVTLEFYLAIVRLSGDFREWRQEWRNAQQGV